MAHFKHAICRRPGPELGSGQTTATLGAPDFAKALAQHDAYVATLRELGLEVTVLDALPDYPDAHYVEDTAVVTPHVAVITLPGHPSRQGEQESIAAVLADHRPLARIAAPGAIDGGDVLMCGNHFFIGISERTNAAGAAQLADILAGHGHTASTVPVAAGLHFKSSVNEVGEALLVTSDFLNRPELSGHECLAVPAGEEYAGNVLGINDHLLVPAGFPGVHGLLEGRGHKLVVLEMSEMQKMDGGLTCLSLRF